MEQNVDKKPPRLSVKLPDIDMEGLKKHSHMLVSPTSQATTRKTTNGKLNCLCSPTTHAGSFRCRHHRATGMPRGRSVGSNLSELAKAGSISDSLHARQLALQVIVGRLRARTHIYIPHPNEWHKMGAQLFRVFFISSYIFQEYENFFS